MEAFYFNDNKLFGIYHNPNPNNDKKSGIIMCNPLGQEYIRCYHAFQELAKKLAKKGYHVLRFDYAGTGQSIGESDLLSAKSMILDIESAINELKSGASLENLNIIGLRYGATVATLLGSKNLIDSLVLWSPIINGETYLKELTGINKFYNKNWTNIYNEDIIQEKRDGDLFESMGFKYSSNILRDIKSVLMEKSKFSINTKVLVLNEKNNKDFRNIACNLKDSNPKITFDILDHERFWLKNEDEKEKSLIPISDLNKIIKWFENIG